MNQSKYATTIFIIAVIFFFMAIHFVDLSFNMDSQCMDKNFFGYTQSKTEMYTHGLFGLFMAFSLFIISFFLILNQIKF